MANIEEYTANHPEKYGKAIIFKNKKGEDVVRLNVKKEQYEDLKEYLIPSDAQIIQEALTAMEEYLGTDYEQQNGGLRTDMTEEALEKMDCSEFMSRYLQKLGLFEDVPLIITNTFRDDKAYEKTEYGEKLQFIPGSKELDFIPRPGDVFVWSRSKNDGHTGVVLEYDKENDYVIIIESIGCKEPCSNDTQLNIDRGCCKVVQSTYKRTGNSLASHEGWIGYFRPVLN